MKDLFQTMTVFAPTDQVYIEQIDIDNRTGGIGVDLILSTGKIKSRIISHELFRTWLEDNGRLEWVSDSSDHTGQHVQVTGQIGYVEFLNGRLDAELIHEYLTEKGLTSLKYNPA